MSQGHSHRRKGKGPIHDTVADAEYQEKRRRLRAIYQETVQIVCSPMSNFPAIECPIRYDFNNTPKKPPLKHGTSANVIVVDMHTFECVATVADKKKISTNDIMALNLASFMQAGGGVENGADAQEEELFYWSDYFRHLPHTLYPLDTYNAILSRDVTVFRDKDYVLLPEDKRFRVNCLAVAALRNPDIDPSTGAYKYDKQKEIMQFKIEQIFKIAYQHGYRTLVLGALGCGAYCNPNFEVANMFADAIKKYQYCFDNIYFAVLAKGATGRENLEVFKTYVEAVFHH